MLLAAEVAFPWSQRTNLWSNPNGSGSNNNRVTHAAQSVFHCDVDKIHARTNTLKEKIEPQIERKYVAPAKVISAPQNSEVPTQGGDATFGEFAY